MPSIGAALETTMKPIARIYGTATAAAGWQEVFYDRTATRPVASGASTAASTIHVEKVTCISMTALAAQTATATAAKNGKRRAIAGRAAVPAKGTIPFERALYQCEGALSDIDRTARTQTSSTPTRPITTFDRKPYNISVLERQITARADCK